MAPFISGLFGYLLLGQRINLRIFIALIIGAIGAIWVIFSGDLNRFLEFRIGRGELLFFIGMYFGLMLLLDKEFRLLVKQIFQELKKLS